MLSASRSRDTRTLKFCVQPINSIQFYVFTINKKYYRIPGTVTTSISEQNPATSSATAALYSNLAPNTSGIRKLTRTSLALVCTAATSLCTRLHSRATYGGHITTCTCPRVRKPSTIMSPVLYANRYVLAANMFSVVRKLCRVLNA